MDGVHTQGLVALEARGLATSELVAGIERIFRASAARWPDDPVAVQAFKYLWLEQYLEHERDLVIVATSVTDLANVGPNIIGYIVGCQIDPAQSPRFAALSYFKEFAVHCVAYPAHLHVNVDAGCRGRRVGERLVEALCERLANAGSPGVHVVTGRDQRNVSFYKRLGFQECARAPRGETEVLFLGRKLGDHATAGKG